MEIYFSTLYIHQTLYRISISFVLSVHYLVRLQTYSTSEFLEEFAVAFVFTLSAILWKIDAVDSHYFHCYVLWSTPKCVLAYLTTYALYLFCQGLWMYAPLVLIVIVSSIVVRESLIILWIGRSCLYFQHLRLE